MAKPSDLSRIWANTPAVGDLVEPSPASKIDSGWLDGEEPPNHSFNWWQNRIDIVMDIINRQGVLEHDINTVYTKDALAAHNGILYISKSAANQGNVPSGTSVEWQSIRMPNIHVGASAPARVEAGNVWLDTDALVIKVYNGGWVISRAIATVDTVAPTTPADGTLWFDKNVDRLKVWDATAGVWKFTDPVAIVQIGTVPPLNPVVGQKWFSSAIGREFIYYDDGGSTQWIDSSPSGAPGLITLEEIIPGESISNGKALTTIAHTLGIEPKNVSVYLRCISATRGFTVGDKVPFTGINTTAGNTYGLVIIVTATELKYKIASTGLEIVGADDGAFFALGGANDFELEFVLQA